MSISFHDVGVAVFLQILPAVCATLDKGKAHLEATGTDPEDVLGFALAEDMQPFHFQIRSVVHHSLGAVAGLRSGHFAPPKPSPPYSWDGLRARVADAHDEIASIAPEEAEALAHRDVLFQAGERKRLFTAEEFVLSWSVPNLHFHATTVYDILRMKGVPLSKRDYLGRLRGRSLAA